MHSASPHPHPSLIAASHRCIPSNSTIHRSPRPPMRAHTRPVSKSDPSAAWGLCRKLQHLPPFSLTPKYTHTRHLQMGCSTSSPAHVVLIIASRPFGHPQTSLDGYHHEFPFPRAGGLLRAAVSSVDCFVRREEREWRGDE